MKVSKLLTLTIILMLCICMAVFVGCKDEPDPSNGVVLNFYIGDKLFKSITYNDANFILPTPPAFDNKKFDSWYFDKTFSKKFTVKNIKRFSKNNSVNIYARYTNIPVEEVTLNFKVNGNIYYTSIFPKGENFDTPKDPTLDNYTFKGWYVDENLTKKFDITYYLENKILEDMTVYAKFEELTANINVYYQNKLLESISTKKSDPIDIKYIMDLYTKNLKSNHNIGKIVIKDSDKEFLLDDFYANNVLSDIDIDVLIIYEYVTVTLKSQNNIIDTIELSKNTPLDIKPLDRQLGYEFVEWQLDNASFNIDKFNENPYRESIILNAKWKDRTSTATIHIEDKTITKTIGSDLAFDMPKPDEYDYKIFKRWYVLEGENKVTFDYATHILDMDRPDINIYAEYIDAVSKVDIYFDGNLVNTQYVNDTNLLILPANLSKVGYHIKNWTNNGAIFDIKEFNTRLETHAKVDKHIELIAVLEGNKTTIQLIVDELPFERVICITGDNIILPNAPIKKDQRFVGWAYDKLGNKPFDLGLYMAEQDRADIALYAIYENIV